MRYVWVVIGISGIARRDLVALAFCTVALPAVYVMAKRVLQKVRHQQTEQSLITHTRNLLNTQEATSWRAVTIAKEPDAETPGERRLAALNTDGSAAPLRHPKTLWAALRGPGSRPAQARHNAVQRVSAPGGEIRRRVLDRGRQNINIEYSDSVMNEICPARGGGLPSPAPRRHRLRYAFERCRTPPGRAAHRVRLLQRPAVRALEAG
jgi:hypothetical protein